MADKTDTASYKAEVDAKNQERRGQIRSAYEDFWKGRTGMREWAERSQGAPDYSRFDASSPTSSMGYRRGGIVKKGSYTVPQMCKGGKVIRTYK